MIEDAHPSSGKEVAIGNHLCSWFQEGRKLVTDLGTADKTFCELNSCFNIS